MIQDNNIGLFNLLETRVKVENRSRIVERMGNKWKLLDNFNSDPIGRIIVGWDPCKFTVQKMKETNQFVRLEVSSFEKNISFLLSTVYANNDPQERSQLWEELSKFTANIKNPWSVLIDFNNVLKPFERKGGEQVHPRETNPFENCLAVLG